jgi:hypothetical protein
MREVTEHMNSNFLYFPPVLKKKTIKSQGQLLRLCAFMHLGLFLDMANFKLH